MTGAAHKRQSLRATVLIAGLVCGAACVESATTTTSTILAKTTAALPACLQWRVIGICLWLRCTPLGCDIETSVRVRNYVPDAVVTARNDTGLHPWVEINSVIGAGSGAFDGHGEIEGRNEGARRGRKREHQLYREADVIGHPLSVSGFLSATGVSLEYICLPRTLAFFRYLQSEIDAPVWRGLVPVESLYPAASIPGLREIGTFPLNTWGNVYPRIGRVLQQEQPKAGAVIAQRVGDIVTRSFQPHAYVPLTAAMLPSFGMRYFNPPPLMEGDAGTGTWQMLEPRADASCYVFGGNDARSPIGWSDYRKDDGGDYLFNLWRPYSCCKIKGIFLGTIP